jgi:hypothetical protein
MASNRVKGLSEGPDSVCALQVQFQIADPMIVLMYNGCSAAPREDASAELQNTWDCKTFERSVLSSNSAAIGIWKSKYSAPRECATTRMLAAILLRLIGSFRHRCRRTEVHQVG